MDCSDSACLVCHEVVEVYAVGKCDHPICFKCSTRMRALCDQFYCPICRTDLPEVFFLGTRERFADMPMRKFIFNRKLKIQCENEQIRDMFETLLEYRCAKCPDRPPERSFRALRDHMRRVHTLFYCDLCLELKIFPRERKIYNRQDLATHRRVGDKDDKSYKGHPLCQFCEERYLDKDELFKHLRKEHFFCHFCESLGSQEFYNDYDSLRDHFMNDHFLCEEGDCINARFTNVFREDIDFQSHMATYHSRAQTKSQARQERTLNIDINFAPRPNSRSNRGGRDDYEGRRGGGGPRHQGRGRGGANNNTGRYTTPNPREIQDIDRAIQASLSTMSEEDMSKDKQSKIAESNKSKKDTKREYIQTEENFPSLGKGKVNSSSVTSSPKESSTSPTSHSNSSGGDGTGKTSLADRFAMSHSRSVQHGILDDFPTLNETVPKSERPTVPGSMAKPKVQSAKVRPAKEEDFPELPLRNKPSLPSRGSWSKQNNSGKEKDEKQHRASPVNQPSARSQNNSHSSKQQVKYSDNDFPSLGVPTVNSSSGRWVSNSKTSTVNNNTSKHINKSRSSDDLESMEDIRQRFSPVNVPTSPKNERAKNKKKKKLKDKVFEIKDEAIDKQKSKASLDDIANLLMYSSVSNADNIDAKKPAQVKQGGLEMKPKKKEDKVEKKLESKKREIKAEPAGFNLYDDFEQVAEPVHIIKPEPVRIEKPEPIRMVRPPKFKVAEEDFPSLGGQSGPTSPSKPPPGFRDNNVPPGLQKPKPSSNSVPPPGFMSHVVDNRVQDDQDFPAASSMHIDNFKYSPPDDFQGRNQMLIATIQSMCDGSPTKFADFKTYSGEFRRSEINASLYYQKCEEILGKANFDQVFPELMALLPDINTQKELLSVYMSTLKKDEGVLKISGKFKDSKGAWTPSRSGFLTCHTCGQVLCRNDYNNHVSSHNLDSDFPSLMSGGSTSGQKFGQGPWVRAK